jgi:hypothetical protein
MNSPSCIAPLLPLGESAQSYGIGRGPGRVAVALAWILWQYLYSATSADGTPTKNSSTVLLAILNRVVA